MVKKVSSQSPFSLFRYLKPYRVQCVVGPLFKLAEAVLELYMPFLLAQVIDRGIATGDYAYVRRMAFVLVGIVTAGLGMALVCQYLATRPRRASAPRCAMSCSVKSCPSRTAIPTASGAPDARQSADQRRQPASVCGRDAHPAGHPRAVSVRRGIIMAFVLDWRLALIIVAVIRFSFLRWR